MDEQQVTSFLVIFSIVAFCLALTMILLFVLFQKRKNRLLREQQEAENRFREALITIQNEIREETLRNVSWELHDNIGQLLTLARIQLQRESHTSPYVQEASDTIAKSLSELRSLSKSINPDTIKGLSLVDALSQEIDRFNRMQYLNASLHTSNHRFELDPKIEVIIFRMLQEFFTNTVKHSKATSLEVSVHYEEAALVIKASDNGVGFDPTERKAHRGIGLTNIQHRAELIGAEVQIESSEGRGTHFYLTLKRKL
ncbi:MAG: histidine kinase [Flavobacteriaceae bacterium]|nr:histidine kinase [Flavobacteriaceae bacterium]|tara:strand:+ start:1950 stop:2717 length:768 start_codon:yes stop_codon:yes gene_type:complete